VNLLQPHDRRSTAAGDTRDSVVARARLIARGIGTAALGDVAARAVAAMRDGDVVVDLGSGAGELLGAIADRLPVTAIGIDLSTAAAEQAARRYPHVTWVVANADRRLPLLDRCVDVVLSLHGRRNPPECARVLTPAGLLIVAVPAADDLIELREHVHGHATERDRGDALIEEHRAMFDVVERSVVRERHHASPDAVRDVLRGTYRGARTSEASRLTTLPALDITIASEVVVLRPRP
jgi:23S rRNA (guanine745-N1)-methyltransferase